MKTLRNLILVLLSAVILLAFAVIPASAGTSTSSVQAGDILDLTGIGTDELEFFSFYYSNAADGQNPTEDMKPLTRVKKGVSNGSWPFNVDNKLYAYEDEGWTPDTDNTRTQLVYFPKDDPSKLFVCPRNLADEGKHFRSIIAFTAPSTGNYTLSFDGSVSWSPDSMDMNVYVNGTKTGNSFVFSAVVNDPANASHAPYSITFDLNEGEKICLVFSNIAASINRANIMNLQVEVNSCENNGGNNGNTGNDNTGNDNTGNGDTNTGNNNAGNNVNNNTTNNGNVNTKNLIAVLLITTDFLVGLGTGLVLGAGIFGVVILIVKNVKKKK